MDLHNLLRNKSIQVSIEFCRYGYIPSFFLWIFMRLNEIHRLVSCKILIINKKDILSSDNYFYSAIIIIIIVTT